MMFWMIAAQAALRRRAMGARVLAQTRPPLSGKSAIVLEFLYIGGEVLHTCGTAFRHFNPDDANRASNHKSFFWFSNVCGTSAPPETQAWPLSSKAYAKAGSSVPPCEINLAPQFQACAEPRRSVPPCEPNLAPQFQTSAKSGSLVPP